MEGRLFEDLVVSGGGAGRGRAGGMPVSFMLHAAGLTGLLALSVLGPEEMPAPPRPTIGEVVFAAGPRAPSPPRPPQPTARNPRPADRALTPIIDALEEPPPVEPEPFAAEHDQSDARCIGCAPSDEWPAGGGGSDDRRDEGTRGTGAAGTGTDPIRVGGLIQAPRKIRHVDPAYPDLARRAGIAGVVVLECVIDRGGLIRSVQVVRGHPLLNEAAVSAVRQWAYRPTLLNGVPVAVVMTVTVRFSTR